MRRVELPSAPARLPCAAGITRRFWDGDVIAIDDGRIDTAGSVTAVEGRHPGRLARRLVLALLVVVVLLAAGGLTGVRTSSVSASKDGYTITVTYALIARAGLDVPWRVTVERPGGFDEDITIGVTARYFDIFETQGFHPNPDMETGDGDLVYLTFTAPAGPIFSTDFDAYIQPSSQLSERADVVLLVDDRPLLSVSYTTWLVP